MNDDDLTLVDLDHVLDTELPVPSRYPLRWGYLAEARWSADDTGPNLDIDFIRMTTAFPGAPETVCLNYATTVASGTSMREPGYMERVHRHFKSAGPWDIEVAITAGPQLDNQEVEDFLGGIVASTNTGREIVLGSDGLEWIKLKEKWPRSSPTLRPSSSLHELDDSIMEIHHRFLRELPRLNRWPSDLGLLARSEFEVLMAATGEEQVVCRYTFETRRSRADRIVAVLAPSTYDADDPDKLGPWRLVALTGDHLDDVARAEVRDTLRSSLVQRPAGPAAPSTTT